MRRAAALLLTVAALTSTGAGQTLSGNYTVGAGGNYATLTAAITDLVTFGVSGPTNFTVLGNETGPWAVTAIPGQGFANPVVFEGNGVSVLSGVGTPALISFNGCSNVSFSGFVANLNTGDTGVLVGTGTTDCAILNCTMTQTTSTSSSGGKTFDLQGGTGFRIEGNTFGGGYEAWYCASANDTTIMQKNTITGGGWWIGRIGGTNFTMRNNFVVGNSNYGVSCGISGNGNGDGLAIENNTFYIVHNSGGSQYCSLRWYSSGVNTRVVNNIITDIYATGTNANYNMWCSGSLRPAVMDYNLLWAPNSGGLIYGSAALNLAGWQALGFDLNSQSVDPFFIGAPTDLRILSSSPAVGAGTTIAGLADDFFGQPRTPPVDVGAHESSSYNLLQVTTSGNGTGDVNVSLTNLDPAAAEGYLLSTFVTSGNAGSGPVFGIYPDSLTFAILAEPLYVGNFLHFRTTWAGAFPQVPFTQPAGTLSGLFGQTMDSVAILFGPNFNFVGQSNVTRVTW